MSSSQALTQFGPLSAFLSSATWAWGSSRYSELTRSHSAFAVNCSRAIGALPFFILATFVVAGGWSQGLAEYAAIRPSHLGWFTLSMLATYGLGDSVLYLSTRSLGVPGALAIASSYPIWTTLSGIVLSQDQVSARQLGGLFSVVTGVVLVILAGVRSKGGPVSGDIETSPPKAGPESVWAGAALAFFTSLCWGVGSYAISRGGGDLSSSVGNTIRMASAIPFCAIMSRIVAPQSSVVFAPRKILRLIHLFAIEGFGGSSFYVYGLSHSALVVGATLTSLAPVLALPVALARRTEKFSSQRALAVFLVVVGIVLLVGNSS